MLASLAQPIMLADTARGWQTSERSLPEHPVYFRYARW